MHFLMLILGIICVIGGFALAELKENNTLKLIGSFIMLAGFFLTFTGILNILVPNFFQS